MEIRFWGTRGSIAAAGPETVRYGGNTSCVSVTAADGTQVVLDTGTGIRTYGAWLLGQTGGAPRAHLLITHTHWDHIQGFPFFGPAYAPAAHLAIYGTPGLERTLEASLAGQMEHTYFPVHLHELPARMQFVEVGEGWFRADGVDIRAQFLNHTALTLGYRLQAGGASVVYATDHEPFWWGGADASPASRLAHPGDARHAELFRDADLLIHDVQYLANEYPQRRGWGHSVLDYVVDLACLVGVKRLALFHHDPGRTDAELDAVVAAGRERAHRSGAALDVFAAAEGQVVEVPERRPSVAPPEPGLISASALRGRTVLLAGDDARDLTRLSEALSGDGYQVRMVLGLAGVPAFVAERPPDLAVLSFGARIPGRAPAIEALRGHLACPIVAIVDDLGPRQVRQLERLGVDGLSRPWAPPMLRARVRVWLARARPARAGMREDGAALALPSAPAFVPELFRGLPREELAALLTPAASLQFNDGEVLFNEGDPTGGVYFVREGAVKLTLALPGEDELAVGFALPGDTIGELAALDGSPRTASATAVEPTIADYLPREAFLAALEQSPRLGLRLMRLLADRLRHADSAHGELAFGGVFGRVARRLLYLARGQAGEVAEDSASLAAMVRVEPGQALEVLRALEAAGVISVREGGVAVLEPDGLLPYLLS